MEMFCIASGAISSPIGNKNHSKLLHERSSEMFLSLSQTHSNSVVSYGSEEFSNGHTDLYYAVREL